MLIYPSRKKQDPNEFDSSYRNWYDHDKQQHNHKPQQPSSEYFSHQSQFKKGYEITNNLLGNPLGIKNNMYVMKDMGVDGELLVPYIKASANIIPTVLLTLLPKLLLFLIIFMLTVLSQINNRVMMK